jgi:exodeoxyribonuclease-3|nr:exodeoxyribonuclease III [Kofleriaceae bacterium]
MKLATWNINSVRMRIDRLTAWLGRQQPDVVCLQEIKVEDSGFPHDALGAAGYTAVTFGQRSYNGVAILARTPLTLTDVARGFGDGGEGDDEARVIAAKVGGTQVVCLYVPNGQDLTSDRYPYKLAWFGRLRAYLERTASPSAPLVVCGDMNVTADDRDVWSPAQWAGKIHCSQPERDAYANMVAFGLADVFRAKHPEGGVYSWWDYRGVSFFKNQGLRIDHILATAPVAAACTACTVDRDARKGQDASDHAPVIAELAL